MTESSEPQSGVSRRSLLWAGFGTATGVAAGAGLATAAHRGAITLPESADYATADPVQSPSLVATRPARLAQVQPGIVEDQPLFAALLAFTLRPGVDLSGLTRLWRVWTEDARALMAAEAPLADPEPELAQLAADLTVTFGFGPGLFQVPGLAALKPAWLTSLPAFKIDKLQDQWSGGDLLIQVCANDPLAVTHAVRSLRRSGLSLVEPKWLQRGYRSPTPHTVAQAAAGGSAAPLARNAFGQVDGTINPHPASDPADDAALWLTSADDVPAWLVGGTSMVLRRIAMDMPGWDQTPRPVRERTLGRDLAHGAPLSGGSTNDEADFEARDAAGNPLIAPHAHIRRAHTTVRSKRMLRRGYTYEQDGDVNAEFGTGLLFIAFQRDLEKQFIAVQRMLAEHDLLNEWTTPIGSSVWAIPPNPKPDEYLGQALIDAAKAAGQ